MKKHSDKYVEPHTITKVDKKTGKKYTVEVTDIDTETGMRKESERED
jgi:hypothetical protein